MRKTAARLLTLLLCCLYCAFPAFAGGDGTDTAEGEPFYEKAGLVTRDLLYDKATNKQFITVEDREGNIFYIIIDYDAPVDAETEQYETHFLNAVDAEDLEALAEKSEEKPPVCICKNKCAPGSVNMNCPVCAANLNECRGIPAEPPKPEVPEEPAEPPEEEPSALTPLILFTLLAALAAAGFGFLMRKKQADRKAAENAPDPDDCDLLDVDWQELDHENEQKSEDESAEPDSETDLTDS